MFKFLKRKVTEPENPWRVVDKFWGGARYNPDRVEYPDNSRMVDLSVVNGNVGHGMKGLYHKGQWFSDDWSLNEGTTFRPIVSGITVIAWREIRGGVGRHG